MVIISHSVEVREEEVGEETQFALLAAFSIFALLELVFIFLFHNATWNLYRVLYRPVYWPIQHSDILVIKSEIETSGTVAMCQVQLKN